MNVIPYAGLLDSADKAITPVFASCNQVLSVATINFILRMCAYVCTNRMDFAQQSYNVILNCLWENPAGNQESYILPVNYTMTGKLIIKCNYINSGICSILIFFDKTFMIYY